MHRSCILLLEHPKGGRKDGHPHGPPSSIRRLQKEPPAPKTVLLALVVPDNPPPARRAPWPRCQGRSLARALALPGGALTVRGALCGVPVCQDADRPVSLLAYLNLTTHNDSSRPSSEPPDHLLPRCRLPVCGGLRSGDGSLITEARTGRLRRQLELLRSHPKDERGSVREMGL